MADIAAWLLAQIAEREAAARAADTAEVHWLAEYGASATSDASEAHIKRHDPAWALADCAVHKAIVAEHKPMPEPSGKGFYCWSCGAEGASVAAPCDTLRLLAQLYADRPGWDPAWKVGT